MKNDTEKKVHMFKASAGTGKTFKLTKEINDYLAKDDVSSVMATTFTNKAADELRQRFRKKLLASKDPKVREKAIKILTGNFGTINSIFGKIVLENAFELGLSPELEQLDENTQDIFFDAVASKEFVGAVNDKNLSDVLDRFGKERKDWEDQVKKICRHCLQNNITDLADSCKRSLEIIDEMLPTTISETEVQNILDLNEKFYEFHKNDKNKYPGRKKIKSELKGFDKLEVLKDLSNSWSEWLDCYEYIEENPDFYVEPVEIDFDGKKVKGNLKVLDFLTFPQFKNDNHYYIDRTFYYAKEVLDLYEKEKKKNSVIDFNDQEKKSLEIINDTEIPVENTKRLYVDEFQDTNPLQLALFSKMQEKLSNQLETVYVGDPKQSIYAFRGAAPDIIQKLSNEKEEIDIQSLDSCYRSTSAIINFTNKFFKDVFPNYPEIKKGVQEEPKDDYFKKIAIWQKANCKKDSLYRDIAKEINNILIKNPKYQIIDKDSKKERDLQGSDICVLFRSNENIKTFSEIAKDYFNVSSLSGELFDQPIARLIASLFVFMITSDRKQAYANILNVLNKFDSSTKEMCVEEYYKIEDIISFVNDIKKNSRNSLTVSEIFDKFVQGLYVQEYLKHSENLDLDYAILDKIQGLITTYEEVCLAQSIPATPNGFALWIEEGKKSKDDDKFKCPASLDKEAVNVMSIHASKGLEWSIVIVVDCKKYEIDDYKRIYCEHVLSNGDIDLKNPLKNRYIALLPYPFGKKQKMLEGENLKYSYKSTDLRKAIELSQKEEQDRLMYVALTRARDKLIIVDTYEDVLTEDDILQTQQKLKSDLDDAIQKYDDAKADVVKREADIRDKPTDNKKGILEKKKQDLTKKEYSVKLAEDKYTKSLSLKPSKKDNLYQYDWFMNNWNDFEVVQMVDSDDEITPYSKKDFKSIKVTEVSETKFKIAKKKKQSDKGSEKDQTVEYEYIDHKINPSTTKEHFYMDLQFKDDPKIVNVYRSYAYDGTDAKSSNEFNVEEVAGEVNSDLGTMVHLALSVEDLSDEMAENLSKSDYNKSPKTGKLILSKDDLKAIRKDFYDNIKNVADGYKDLLKEWPIYMKVGNQLVNGSVDMIALCDDGFYIIDHKILKYTGKKKNNTTGEMEDWSLDAFEKDKIKQYAPEQLAYVKVVKELTGLECKGVILHLPFQNRFVVCNVIKDKPEKK